MAIIQHKITATTDDILPTISPTPIRLIAITPQIADGMGFAYF
jgi:hypothetical protein